MRCFVPNGQRAFEGVQLVIVPRPDLVALGPLDANGGIVVEPLDVDGVADQDAKLLQCVERCAWAERL